MRRLRTGLLATSLVFATVGCGCQPPQIAKVPKSNNESAAVTTPRTEGTDAAPQPRLPVIREPESGKVDPPRKPDRGTPAMTLVSPAAMKKGQLDPTATQPKPAPPAERPQPAATVHAQDMKDIHLLVDTFSMAGGKMPDIRVIYLALVEAKSPAAALVKSGDIVLTGATQRESLWAIQKDAFVDGGWIVTHNGAEQVDAATAGRWLGGRDER